MLRSLQLTVLLLELLLATPAEPQNLRKPMCPVRNMDVEDNINASILDDHFVYACEMFLLIKPPSFQAISRVMW
ncbi:hypothetical protein PF003_g2676 [Phytophthora fragariae]|nr:hypothetical protein PF003_g2676 [Phytophthora fragariae]